MAAPSNAVDRLLDKISNNLGRTNDSVVTDYRIVWANEAQREICNRASFWFMQASTTMSFVQSDLSQALPSDFKDIDAVWIKTTNPDGFVELFPMSIEDQRRQYDDVTEQEPGFYRAEGGNSLVLRPVPDQAYTVQLDYWKYLADLVAAGSSNELLDNYSGIIESGATYRGFRRLGELEDAGAWKKMFNGDIADLVVQNAERVLPNEFILKTRPDALGTTIGSIKGRPV